MRARALSLLLFVSACGGSDDKHDLSSEMDLSVADLSADRDLSVPDLTVPLEGIAGVRAAAQNNPSGADGGMLTMSIPVVQVLVTYVRPEVSGEKDDPAGFFLQDGTTGPAVFVSIDPSQLNPVPAVGDKVTFTATGANVDAGGVSQITYLKDWAVASSGNDRSVVVQDLSSATDLVSNVAGYESELSTVTGTLIGSFSGSGNAYVAADFATAGLPGPTGVPKLRVPSALRDALDLSTGCALTIGPTPMWRYQTKAEVSAWVAGDVTITSCPAPRVVSAIATDLTHVDVTFDRAIKPSSLVADGSQLVVSGLTISAAMLSSTTVVTITTSTQTASTAYTVTVAASLTDGLGTGVDAAHNNAPFTGYVPPAKVIINELNANISGGSDLVELLVTQGGSLVGFKLYQDYSTAHHVLLATMPSNLVVTTGDFILVHLGVAPAATPAAGVLFNEFNVGNADGNPIAQCTATACVATAWDVGGIAAVGLPMTRRIVSIVDGTGNVLDAIAYSNQTGGSSTFGGNELQAAINAGFWSPQCTNNPCGTDDTAAPGSTDFDSTAFNVKAPALGTTMSGVSAQRMGTTQPSSAASWHTVASSWGAANN
jgi:hypothetical protein